MGLARFLKWGLPIGMAWAGIVTLLGGGSGTAGRLAGHCVILEGDGWAPSTCTEPAADAVESNPAPEGHAGDMGATAYGPVLTAEQIRQLWVAHGGDPATVDTAAAVALAESGGRPGATNHSNSNGTVDRGLFQINSIHGANSTYDLGANVAYAVQLSHGGHNWSPWVAYTSGAYRRYLGVA